MKQSQIFSSNTQRVRDISPKMREIISGISQDVNTRAESILQKGSLGYNLEEAIEDFNKNPQGYIGSHISTFMIPGLSFMEKDGQDLSFEAKKEFQELENLSRELSLKIGRFQLEESRKMTGINSVVIQTRGRVGIILNSSSEEEMIANLA